MLIGFAPESLFEGDVGPSVLSLLPFEERAANSASACNWKEARYPGSLEEFSPTLEFAVELLIADKSAAEADDKLAGVRVGGGGMREDKVLGKDEESHNPEGP